MQFVNLCGYPASFSVFGEPWGPIPTGENYAWVGRFGIVHVNRAPHPKLGPYLDSGAGFPDPAEGVAYLVTPEVAVVLADVGRTDVIGVRRHSPPRVAPVVVDQG